MKKNSILLLLLAKFWYNYDLNVQQIPKLVQELQTKLRILANKCLLAKY